MKPRESAGPKTQRTDASVEERLNPVDNEGRRRGSFSLVEVMREAWGEEPAMLYHGPSVSGPAAVHSYQPLDSGCST